MSKMTRKQMIFNAVWSALRFETLRNLLSSPVELRDELLTDLENRKSEGEMENTLLPVQLAQQIQLFGEGYMARELYWADFANRIGTTVLTVQCLGWRLVNNDYENAIRISAQHLLESWERKLIIETAKVDTWRLYQASNVADNLWIVFWQQDGRGLIEVEVNLIDKSCKIR